MDDVLNIMLGDMTLVEPGEFAPDIKYFSIFSIIIIHSNSVVMFCFDISCPHSYIHSDNIEMKAIPIDEYKKLLQDSVQLQKLEVINQKLQNNLNKKHADFRRLQKKFHHYEKTEHEWRESSVSSC